MSDEFWNDSGGGLELGFRGGVAEVNDGGMEGV